MVMRICFDCFVFSSRLKFDEVKYVPAVALI